MSKKPGLIRSFYARFRSNVLSFEAVGVVLVVGAENGHVAGIGGVEYLVTQTFDTE
jgi:hypothetical protein